jgi:hypothetical protein
MVDNYKSSLSALLSVPLRYTRRMSFVKVGLDLMVTKIFPSVKEYQNMVFLPLSSHGLKSFIKTGNILIS